MFWSWLKNKLRSLSRWAIALIGILPLIPVLLTPLQIVELVAPPITTEPADVFKLLAAVLASLIALAGFFRTVAQASEAAQPAWRELSAWVLRRLLGAIILLVEGAAALFCMHLVRQWAPPFGVQLVLQGVLGLIVSICIVPAGFLMFAALHAIQTFLAQD